MSWWISPQHAPCTTAFRIRTADGHYYHAWPIDGGWEVHFPHGLVRRYTDEFAARRAINRCIKQMEENADPGLSSMTI